MDEYLAGRIVVAHHEDIVAAREPALLAVGNRAVFDERNRRLTLVEEMLEVSQRKALAFKQAQAQGLRATHDAARR